MFLRRGINTKTVVRPPRNERLDSIRRWATEGARSFSQLPRQSIHVPSRPDSLLYRKGWFGSNREGSGYTPAGVVSVLGGQENARFRNALVRAVLRAYRRRFYRVNLERACDILNKLGNGDDVFYWASECSEITRWTPNKLNKLAPTLRYKVHTWYATSIDPVKFVGGPPSQCSIFKGSLLTLLLDRITVAVLLGGMKNLDGIILPDDNYSVTVA